MSGKTAPIDKGKSSQSDAERDCSQSDRSGRTAPAGDGYGLMLTEPKPPGAGTAQRRQEEKRKVDNPLRPSHRLSVKSTITDRAENKDRRGNAPGRRELCHIPAAIDADGLPRQVIAFRKHDRGARDFFWSAKEAHGDAIARSVGIGNDHIGLDQCRSDGVDGDALAG